MPDEDITICLMGDTKYGKTSLIATLCGCVNQKAHGFDTAYAFKAEPEGPSGLTREGWPYVANRIASGKAPLFSKTACAVCASSRWARIAVINAGWCGFVVVK